MVGLEAEQNSKIVVIGGIFYNSSCRRFFRRSRHPRFGRIRKQTHGKRDMGINNRHISVKIRICTHIYRAGPLCSI